MKLVCQRDHLLDIINTVQKAIAPKTPAPILECIKIDADGNGDVIITGNSIENCIEYNTKISVPEGGQIALTSKMFGEIVRRMPDGDVTISVNPDNNVTQIKCGASKFNIQGMNAYEFPAAPILDERFRFTLGQDRLKRIIRKTINFVAASEGKKPILTGVLFEIKNNVLSVVASDGHRLAVVREELKDEVPNSKFVVPGATLREVLKLLKDEETVDIIVSERHIMFDFGSYQFYTRQMDGDFLKYEAIISVSNDIKVICEKSYITDSLERAQLLINDDMSVRSDNKVPVRFNIGFNKIDISCITSKGQVNDVVPAEINGGELLIGFNCRFMLDALSACDDEKVLIEFSAPTSGCFVRSTTGDESYIYMILPVRLYN
ncbi:MAG: DNA polymerase III subunit beta [Clostridiales bacterium]|nr:DNA polymerase III subunit beta [Clostridiales bacterium]